MGRSPDATGGKTSLMFDKSNRYKFLQKESPSPAFGGTGVFMRGK
jgi:hypothetical protein